MGKGILSVRDLSLLLKLLDNRHRYLGACLVPGVGRGMREPCQPLRARRLPLLIARLDRGLQRGQFPVMDLARLEGPWAPPHP